MPLTINLGCSQLHLPNEKNKTKTHPLNNLDLFFLNSILLNSFLESVESINPFGNISELDFSIQCKMFKLSLQT